MADPRYDSKDPLVGALMELSAAGASLSGHAIQPEHAREHVICAMELVKRAHRKHIDTRAPSTVAIYGRDGWVIIYSESNRAWHTDDLIEVVW